MSRLPKGLDPDVDWISTTEVAELLAVSRTRVTQLVRKGFLPAVRPGRRRYYFRLHQVEVVANAREARKISGTLGRGIAAVRNEARAALISRQDQQTRCCH